MQTYELVQMFTGLVELRDQLTKENGIFKPEMVNLIDEKLSQILSDFNLKEQIKKINED